MGFDEAELERCGTVLRQAFISAQIGMPSEDMETAVETLWIILEALMIDHLAPDEELLRDRADRRTDIGTQWRRMVTAAVTNTFVLGGVFVMPEELMLAASERGGPATLATPISVKAGLAGSGSSAKADKVLP